MPLPDCAPGARPTSSRRRRGAALMAAVLTGSALALSACGSHEAAPMTTVVAESLPAGVTAAEVEFAQGMIPHHRQALVMADLAPSRAASPQVTALAAEIRAAQDPEIAQMTAWLTAWNQPQPAADAHEGDHSGHSSMAGMASPDQLAALEAATGEEFDRLFLELMIAHHEGALQMAEPLRSSTVAEVAELAEAVVAGQTAEIAEMKALLAGA